MNIAFSIGDPIVDDVVDLRRIGSLPIESKSDSSWGGINVKPSNLIRLYGDVSNTYGLSKSIPVNKFTKVRLSLYEKEAVGGVGFCLYELYSSALSNDTNFYCIVLRGGRFVKLSSFTKTLQTTKDVNNDLVGNPTNLALKKMTRQSTIFGPGDAGNAVDGSIKSNFDYDAWELNSVTHTLKELNPWWEVDLGMPYRIQNVRIYKRVDKYEGNLSEFRILLYDSLGKEVWKKDLENTSNEGFFIVDFDGSTGQKIRIVLLGDSERVLCLSEVQVFGFTYTFDLPIGKLLNFPEMAINRIAFMQELSTSSRITGFSEKSESTHLKDFFIYNDKNQEVAVSTLIENTDA